MNNLLRACLLAGFASATIVACGSGDDAPPQVAVVQQDAVVPASKQSVAALSGTTVSFAAVPAFGTTGTTTLKIDVPVVAGGTSQATLGTPTFNIASAGGTASGNLTFGSCIFEITSSSFTEGPLRAGQKITVSPCTIVLDTGGNAAGQTSTVNTNVDLAGASSTPVPVAVTVTATGQVQMALPPAISTVLGTTTVTAGTTTVVLTTGGT